jgi:hypothetical protein
VPAFTYFTSLIFPDDTPNPTVVTRECACFQRESKKTVPMWKKIVRRGDNVLLKYSAGFSMVSSRCHSCLYRVDEFRRSTCTVLPLMLIVSNRCAVTVMLAACVGLSRTAQFERGTVTVDLPGPQYLRHCRVNAPLIEKPRHSRKRQVNFSSYAGAAGSSS